jgi:transposase
VPGSGADSKKKTLIAQEQDRPDVAKKRIEWRDTQGLIDPASVVFIDETWAKTNMTRRYGRSEMGSRVIEKVPFGRWETTTFLGALRATGFIAPLTIDGPISGPLFRSWVEQHLVPELKPGDIVVMDNLSSHKVVGIREAIEGAGAELRYLPPYSPDFAPHRTLRSSWRFRNSRRCFETERKGPSTEYGSSVVPSSINSSNSSAETTSSTEDTALHKMEPL